MQLSKREDALMYKGAYEIWDICALSLGKRGHFLKWAPIAMFANETQRTLQSK